MHLMTCETSAVYNIPKILCMQWKRRNQNIWLCTCTRYSTVMSLYTWPYDVTNFWLAPDRSGPTCLDEFSMLWSSGVRSQNRRGRNCGRRTICRIPSTSSRGLSSQILLRFSIQFALTKMGLRSYVRVYTASDSCCTCRSVQLSKQFEKRYYDVIVHSLKSFDNRLIYLMIASSKLIAWEVRADLFLNDDQHDRSTCVRRALKSLSGN